MVWFIPFLAGMALSSFHTSQRVLFETIMPVILSITAVAFLMLRRQAVSSFSQGLALGGAWLAMSIGLDLLMFMWGPMKMSFADYMKDIGLTYLMYPIIAAGAGFLASNWRQISNNS
jgi:hypothetical protein